MIWSDPSGKSLCLPREPSIYNQTHDQILKSHWVSNNVFLFLSDWSVKWKKLYDLCTHNLFLEPGDRRLWESSSDALQSALATLKDSHHRFRKLDLRCFVAYNVTNKMSFFTLLIAGIANADSLPEVWWVGGCSGGGALVACWSNRIRIGSSGSGSATALGLLHWYAQPL